MVATNNDILRGPLHIDTRREIGANALEVAILDQDIG